MRLWVSDFRFWWKGGMGLWVSDFGGMSDEEKEMERWRPAVARRVWVEVGSSGAALHHGNMRQRDRE